MPTQVMTFCDDSVLCVSCHGKGYTCPYNLRAVQDTKAMGTELLSILCFKSDAICPCLHLVQPGKVS